MVLWTVVAINMRLCNGRIVLLDQLDELECSIQQHDQHNQECEGASKRGLYTCLSFQVKRWDGLAKHIDAVDLRA